MSIEFTILWVILSLIFTVVLGIVMPPLICLSYGQRYLNKRFADKEEVRKRVRSSTAHASGAALGLAIIASFFLYYFVTKQYGDDTGGAGFRGISILFQVAEYSYAVLIVAAVSIFTMDMRRIKKLP
jgi:ABC-type Fe3+ transport system permease subunit